MAVQQHSLAGTTFVTYRRMGRWTDRIKFLVVQIREARR